MHLYEFIYKKNMYFFMPVEKASQLSRFLTKLLECIPRLHKTAYRKQVNSQSVSCDLINLMLFSYIMWLARCMCTTYLRNIIFC